MDDVPRRVVAARIIGVMQRDAPKVKLKMFMVSVIWSNDVEMIVYRLFQDFKKFHRQLKRSLTFVDPLQGIKRRIPKFRTRAMRSSLQQKGSSRSVSRMKFLSLYLTELMMCDPIVTESAELTQFFMPKNHDLQPDFTKNSIMMLLSEDLSDGTDVTAGIRRGSVTYPFVTQTYRCLGDYETKDTKNLPFKVTVNQKLDVLIKDPGGWWLVENEDKRMAWFPAPYLKLCQEEDDDCVEDDDEELSGSVQRAVLYCAVRNYSTKKHDELSLTIGSVVELLRKSDSGWWFIRNKGKTGYVPALYLQPYKNPRACLHNLKNKLPSSTLNLTTTDSPIISRSVSYYSCTLHEEHNSHNASIQPMLESDGTTRLHSDSSLDGRKSSASMASDFSTFSTISIPGSCKSHISSTPSEVSIYSSMNSPESGFCAYSDGGRTVLDLSPIYRPRSLQEHRQNRPRHTCSPLSRMSDGGRIGRDLSPTYRPHLCSCSDSSDSDTSRVSKAEPVAPRVPPRPRAQDILTRCTTMTRKAALASKARILSRQDRAIHIR